MNNWKVWAMYFSPTGTTKKIVQCIAEQIAADMCAPLDTFDFTLPKARETTRRFHTEDIVVFGVPVYAGRVPNVLLKYLDTLQGGGALAVPVVLYGNRNYDDALIELRDLLEKGNFHTVAAAAFIGEHSFSRVLAGGRPDALDMEKAKKFAGKIGFDGRGTIQVKGNKPVREYYKPRDRKGNAVDIRRVKPKTKDTCTDCKICAQVCPMGSIDFDNIEEFTGICIKCGACIKKCPEGAKYYDDEGYLYHQHELEEEFIRRAEPEVFL